MDKKQQFLIAGIFLVSFVLWNKWSAVTTEQAEANLASEQVQLSPEESYVPGVPSQTVPSAQDIPNLSQQASSVPDVSINAPAVAQYITVETDLVIAKINTNGGGIESLVLKEHLKKAEDTEVKFSLMKNTAAETFVSQSGLIGNNGTYPNHKSLYSSSKTSYDLGGNDKIEVPLTWVSAQGIEFTKVFTFQKGSYLIDVNFDVKNTQATPWKGYFYAQFKRSQPLDLKKGGLVQLPSFMGGVQYTPEDKYNKVSFKDISKSDLNLNTDSGWIGMLQHYFAGVWLSEKGADKKYKFYSKYIAEQNPKHIMGFQQQTPLALNAGETGSIGTRAFIGPKTQEMLKAIEKDQDVEGLSLTVDYGWLTAVSDPLFWLLNKINNGVNNWGWSIILLTILIKLAFFPLASKSYKSMARMKKLQPRMTVLKERFKDDRQALQQEMMKMYKEEKVNPAGGCLPMLVQIPVFIALYYVLLESVEIRHAPFALWLQDLSSPDHLYILPILMGASMMLQFKLNPSPMDPMQQKIMMIMPVVMTFLFVTFPSGLVLYWVVNNILSIAQQWFINKSIEKE